jgi:hypothetical protein
MAGFLGDIGMGDAVLNLHGTGARRERRVSYTSTGGRVRWCIGRGRVGGSRRRWSRGAPSARRLPPSPPVERGEGRSGDRCGERGEGGMGGCRDPQQATRKEGISPLSATADGGEQFA